jgi:hypothetical protein
VNFVLRAGIAGLVATVWWRGNADQTRQTMRRILNKATISIVALFYLFIKTKRPPPGDLVRRKR